MNLCRISHELRCYRACRDCPRHCRSRDVRCPSEVFQIRRSNRSHPFSLVVCRRLRTPLFRIRYQNPGYGELHATNHAKPTRRVIAQRYLAAMFAHSRAEPRPSLLLSLFYAVKRPRVQRIKKWLMAGRQFQCPFACPLPIVPWWLCRGATGALLTPAMAVELPDMTTSRALKKLCAMRRRLLADTAQLRGVRPLPKAFA
jgi:hypothetical protein